MAAILFILLGTLAISLNDLMFKSLSGDYALHELVFFRSIIALAVLLPFFLYRYGWSVLRTDRVGLHFLRSMLLVLANSLYFAGLASLPLAESAAIVYLAPLLATIMAWLFLDENVGPIRWATVALGLFGCVMIVQPFGATFDPLYILPLAAAFCYGSFIVTTRKLGQSENLATMTVFSVFAFLLTAIAFGLIAGDGRFSDETGPNVAFLLRAWKWPDGADWLFMAAIGAASTVIVVCMSQAYRLGEASLLAPFEYVGLPLNLFWGYAIWSSWPNNLAMFGMTVIVLAGLTQIWREMMIRGRARRELTRGT